MNKLNNYTGILALAAVALIGFIGYKQGWFGDKKS